MSWAAVGAAPGVELGRRVCDGTGVVVSVGVKVGVKVWVKVGVKVKVLVGVCVAGGGGVCSTLNRRKDWTLSPHQKSVALTIEQIVFNAGGVLTGSMQYVCTLQPLPVHSTMCCTSPPPSGGGARPRSWHTDQP